MTDYQKIRKAIEEYLSGGGDKGFLIYPFGEYGIMAKRILNECFGIQESYLVDNRLAQYNRNIKTVSDLREMDRSDYVILLTCANPDSYESVRKEIACLFRKDQIIDPFAKKTNLADEKMPTVGKYSYDCNGNILENHLVESIGAFCCFAAGSTAVVNHALSAISIHDFLYNGYSDGIGYFAGVKHRPEIRKIKKSHIGSDVWLGHNVIITNGADIGNGVIAAAGAVITKDVPDYAVVGGVPAHIIRYRFTPRQIEALNRIKWWNWSDEKIRKCYDDFFLDTDEFIARHIEDKDEETNKDKK